MSLVRIAVLTRVTENGLGHLVNRATWKVLAFNAVLKPCACHALQPSLACGSEAAPGNTRTYKKQQVIPFPCYRPARNSEPSRPRYRSRLRRLGSRASGAPKVFVNPAENPIGHGLLRDTRFRAAAPFFTQALARTRLRFSCRADTWRRRDFARAEP